MYFAMTNKGKITSSGLQITYNYHSLLEPSCNFFKAWAGGVKGNHPCKPQ